MYFGDTKPVVMEWLLASIYGNHVAALPEPQPGEEKYAVPLVLMRAADRFGESAPSSSCPSSLLPEKTNTPVEHTLKYRLDAHNHAYRGLCLTLCAGLRHLVEALEVM